MPEVIKKSVEFEYVKLKDIVISKELFDLLQSSREKLEKNLDKTFTCGEFIEQVIWDLIAMTESTIFANVPNTRIYDDDIVKESPKISRPLDNMYG